MSDFETRLRASGLETFGALYSLYEGYVFDAADPEKLGRVKVLVPEIDVNNPIDTWFRPASMHAGYAHGWFWPPNDGDSVIVCFQRGNPRQPLWYFGGPYSTEQTPYAATLGYPEGEGTTPTRRGFVTQTGHSLILNDEKGKEAVDLVWSNTEKVASLSFFPDGSVQIKNAAEAYVLLDVENKSITVEDVENGNTITLNSDGISIKTKGKVSIGGATALEVAADKIALGDGANQAAVLGNALVDWLNSHTHPTGAGPSGPPVPVATPSLLSQILKVK